MFFADNFILVNPRTYTQSHTPTVVHGGGGGGGGGGGVGGRLIYPLLSFFYMLQYSNRFYLQWKAFDLLYKMRYETSPNMVAILNFGKN